jgi:UDP-glucose:(heptosyl)LPS alpha-1,3-glucosyltransferase
MRVALVYRNFNFGGSIERDTTLLARSLVAQGVEVHCYGDPARRSPGADGLPFHDVRPLVRGASRFILPLERLTFAARATRRLRRDRGLYDLVHVSGPSGWEHDVVTVHEVVRAGQRRWPDRAGRGYRVAVLRAAVAPVLRPEIAVGRAVQRMQFSSGRFRQLIAVTEEVRADLVAEFGIAEELVTVVPYAVPVEVFGEARPLGLRGRLGLGAADQILLFVGHEFERKGLAEAVDALAALPRSVHLVVVGDGPAAIFARRAEESGVGDRVHFLGRTEEPERAFADADLFVLPTRDEPWGIPLIEAMAAGVPVVTTLAAGAARVVAEAGAGVLVPTRSPRDVAEAVAALLADPARRHQLGAAGQAASVRFSGEAQVRAVLAAYEHALARPPLPTHRWSAFATGAT